jgi:hypothetical protein
MSFSFHVMDQTGAERDLPLRFSPHTQHNVLMLRYPRAPRGRGVKFGRKPKLRPQQIDHARKLIEDSQRREDVAALLIRVT